MSGRCWAHYNTQGLYPTEKFINLPSGTNLKPHLNLIDTGCGYWPHSLLLFLHPPFSSFPSSSPAFLKTLSLVYPSCCSMGLSEDWSLWDKAPIPSLSYLSLCSTSRWEEGNKSCSLWAVMSPAFWGPRVEVQSVSLPRCSMAECRSHFFLAEAPAFHTRINIVASNSDIIMSFPYTCSDNFMNSLHPNQLRREPASSGECTDRCGHFPIMASHPLRKASPRPATMPI